jgi:hypothetical protein
MNFLTVFTKQRNNMDRSSPARSVCQSNAGQRVKVRLSKSHSDLTALRITKSVDSFSSLEDSNFNSNQNAFESLPQGSSKFMKKLMRNLKRISSKK